LRNVPLAETLAQGRIELHPAVFAPAVSPFRDAIVPISDAPQVQEFVEDAFPMARGPGGHTCFLLLWLSALSGSSGERYREIGGHHSQLLRRECRGRRRQHSGLR